LRVSGVFSEHGHNFVKTILRIAQEKQIVEVVDDQVTCPTYAKDIAQTLLIISNIILHQQQNSKFGTYHYCSLRAISWYQFALAITENALSYNKTLKLATVIPKTTQRSSTIAERPFYSVLDCTKITTHFAIKQPTWEQGLRQVVTKLC
jgi:dTDP-4-dehydrorhamnose reductase